MEQNTSRMRWFPTSFGSDRPIFGQLRKPDQFAKRIGDG
jgi:hypothetical protein